MQPPIHFCIIWNTSCLTLIYRIIIKRIPIKFTFVFIILVLSCTVKSDDDDIKCV